jgi:Uma2 family endonuclease
MAVPQHQLIFTEEQYLEFERNSEIRHEYVDGHVYAMAGESDEHGDISVNLTMSIGSQLKGTNCRARTKDTKVRSGPLPFSRRNLKGLYSYPDLLVICGDPQHLDKHRDVIINPKVVFEVLSDSTEDFDRKEKFARYREWNPTLTDYVLVSQDQPFVEHYQLRKNGDWVYHMYFSLEATVPIKSIKCSLLMSDIYDRVNFAEAKIEPGETLKIVTTKPRRKK